MPKDTLNRLLVKRLGLRRAFGVEMFLLWWVLFRVAERRHPDSIAELQRDVGVDIRTMYRYVADFREAFGMEPAEFVDKILPELDRRLTVGRLAQVRVPA